MNTAVTSAAEWMVLPKTLPNCRTQTTSYTSPLTPERKNRAYGAGVRGRTGMAPASSVRAQAARRVTKAVR